MDAGEPSRKHEARAGHRLVLVGGGVRTGKSTFALQRARSLGQRRVFLATAQGLDDEMARRIADHARSRGDDFRTIEEPLAVPEALLALRDTDVVVVDCLTLWLSNLLVADADAGDDLDDYLAGRLAALVAALQRRAFHAVVVSNEVGMGIVPESPLGRRFRDVAGAAHQRLAAIADEIYVGVMGVMMRLRPDPVSVQARPFLEETAR